jgi:hypothetical protein
MTELYPILIDSVFFHI